MQYVIEMHNLSKTFKTYKRGKGFKAFVKDIFNRERITIKAVDNINLNVTSGEIIGFLGPNGAGKSTAIKMMTGILFPSSGFVQVLGYNPWEQRQKYVKHIGALFGQKSQLTMDIPAIDMFFLNKHIYNIPKKEFDERLSYMSRLLGVKELIKKPVRQLSLGERMKCEFIMAMLHNPQVVFLDEPTIGLDIMAKEKIRDFIRGVNKKYGTTIILTTHDLEDVEHLAERIVIINHGQIVLDSSMKKIRAMMGSKKYITVLCEKPLPSLPLKGVTIVKNISEYSIQFELNRDITKLKTLIDYINRSNAIVDMTIEDPPIEELIKEVYTLKK